MDNSIFYTAPICTHTYICNCDSLTKRIDLFISRPIRVVDCLSVRCWWRFTIGDGVFASAAKKQKNSAGENAAARQGKEWATGGAVV